MASGGPVLIWLEQVLQADRQSVELTLATRHAALLKQIAPLLQGRDVKGLPAAKAFVPPSLDLNDPAEVDSSLRWFPCGARPTPVVAEIVHKEPPSEPIPEEEHQFPPEMTIESSGSNSSTTPAWRAALMSLLDGNNLFDAFVCAIIVANSICIGVETSLEVEGKGTRVFVVLEHMFLLFYITELGLRFAAYGLDCLKNGWVLFDFILVIMGALSLYILAPIFDNMDTDDEDVKLVKKISGLLVMRTLRLFRLARLLRLTIQFRTLWMLVRGLLGSAGTIFYAFGLISLILYIFSCFALELVTKNLRGNQVVSDIVENHFPNLPVTMLSLMQFVTIDSISGIYFPLVKEEPTLIFLFLPAIFVISVTLMNLVTAVIVEGAIQAGKQDADSLRRYRQYQFMKMLPDLRAKFREMDKDGNDLLTLEEVMNAPAAIKDDLSEYVDGDGLQELFEMIDIDESGAINSDEFCDGIAKLVHSDAPVELIRILKHITHVRKDITELKSGRFLTETQLCPPLPLYVSMHGSP